jgi:hypothetical protein
MPPLEALESAVEDPDAERDRAASGAVFAETRGGIQDPAAVAAGFAAMQWRVWRATALSGNGSRECHGGGLLAFGDFLSRTGKSSGWH